MARSIYYQIKSGGSTTHFHSIGAARTAAKRIAKQTGNSVDIEKMNVKKYHRTGSGSEGIVATVSPNPRGSLLFRTRAAALKYAREHGAKKFSIKKLKRGR